MFTYIFHEGCIRSGDLAKHSKTTRYLSNYEGESYMIKVLFICHGNIMRQSEKASKINDFSVSKGAYYTTTIPFMKEL
jgi:hypothetical protein